MKIERHPRMLFLFGTLEKFSQQADLGPLLREVLLYVMNAAFSLRA